MVGIVILYPADIGHIREMAGYNRIPDTAGYLVHLYSIPIDYSIEN